MGDSQVIRDSVQTLRNGNSSQAQKREAAQQLRALCLSKNPNYRANQVEAKDAGAVMELAKLARTSRDNAIKARAFQALGQLCFNNDKVATVVGEEQEYLRAAEDSLKSESASEDMQLMVAASLSNVASIAWPSHPRLLRMAPLALDLMRNNRVNKVLRSYCVTFLANLANNRASRQSLADMNAVEPLTQVMTEGDAKLRFVVAAEAVAYLIGHEEDPPALRGEAREKLVQHLTAAFSAALKNQDYPRRSNFFYRPPGLAEAIANISLADANKELLVVYGLLGLAKEALSYADNRPNKSASAMPLHDHTLLALSRISTSTNVCRDLKDDVELMELISARQNGSQPVSIKRNATTIMENIQDSIGGEPQSGVMSEEKRSGIGGMLGNLFGGKGPNGNVVEEKVSSVQGEGDQDTVQFDTPARITSALAGKKVNTPLHQELDALVEVLRDTNGNDKAKRSAVQSICTKCLSKTPNYAANQNALIDVGAVQELIELARGPTGAHGNSNDMRSKAYQTLGQLCFNNKSTGIQLGEDQDYLQVASQTLKDSTASKAVLEMAVYSLTNVAQVYSTHSQLMPMAKLAMGIAQDANNDPKLRGRCVSFVANIAMHAPSRRPLLDMGAFQPLAEIMATNNAALRSVSAARAVAFLVGEDPTAVTLEAEPSRSLCTQLIGAFSAALDGRPYPANTSVVYRTQGIAEAVAVLAQSEEFRELLGSQGMVPLLAKALYRDRNENDRLHEFCLSICWQLAQNDSNRIQMQDPTWIDRIQTLCDSGDVLASKRCASLLTLISLNSAARVCNFTYVGPTNATASLAADTPGSGGRGGSSKPEWNRSENVGRQNLIQIKKLTKWSKKPFARGGSALLYTVTYEGELCAAKVLDLSFFKPQHEAAVKKAFQTELATMCNLSTSTRVLRVFGACTSLDRRKLVLVMEYATQGTLRAYLDNNPNISVTLKRRFLRDIAYGMEHLAQRHITHRDLKSTNVLLDDNLGCKIADFGLSKTQNTIMSTMGNTGFRGTFEFAAPEVLNGEPCTEKGDSYAYGVLTWETLSRRRPWQGMSPGQIVAAVMNNRRPDKNALPSGTQDDLVGIMERCWKHYPDQRPSFSEIVNECFDEGTTDDSPLMQASAGQTDDDCVVM